MLSRYLTYVLYFLSLEFTDKDFEKSMMFFIFPRSLREVIAPAILVVCTTFLLKPSPSAAVAKL